MGRRLSGNIGAPINVDRINLRSRTSFGDAPATGRAAMEFVGGRLHTRMPADAAKGYAQVGEAQPIAKWLVEDVAALALTGSIGSIVTSADIGYVARVASPVSLWRLVSVGPAAWEQIGAPPTTDASQLTTGTLPAARLPAPTGLALGGVMRNTGALNEYVRAIDASGALVYGVPSGGGSHTRGTWAARPGSPAAGDSHQVTDIPNVILRCWAPGSWTVYHLGVEVGGCDLASLGTSRNVNGDVEFTQFGPFARVRQVNSAGDITLTARTASRVHAYPCAWEWAIAGDSACGLVVGNPSGDGYVLIDGGNFPAQPASTGLRVSGFNSGFAYADFPMQNFGPQMSTMLFRRIIFMSATSFRIEASNDRAIWTRVNEGTTSRTPVEAGIGTYRIGFGRDSIVLHFLHYAL